MKTIAAKIPEKLERRIDELVGQGWFRTREQIVHEAVRRFLESHEPEMMERFAREDVEWGLRGNT